MKTSMPILQGSDTPFSYKRRVRWGECDPAGVVYTPRFTDFVIEAFNDFLQWLLEAPLQPRLADLDLGTPAKAVSMVFHKSLWPDDLFEIVVHVGEIRTRSFDLQFIAVGEDREAIFDATLSVICVHQAERRSRAIPDDLRSRLEAYRAQFPEPPKSPRPAGE